MVHNLHYYLQKFQLRVKYKFHYPLNFYLNLKFIHKNLQMSLLNFFFSIYISFTQIQLCPILHYYKRFRKYLLKVVILSLHSFFFVFFIYSIHCKLLFYHFIYYLHHQYLVYFNLFHKFLFNH